MLTPGGRTWPQSMSLRWYTVLCQGVVALLKPGGSECSAHEMRNELGGRQAQASQIGVEARGDAGQMDLPRLNSVGMSVALQTLLPVQPTMGSARPGPGDSNGRTHWLRRQMHRPKSRRRTGGCWSSW